jgi:hypothetical protein
MDRVGTPADFRRRDIAGLLRMTRNESVLLVLPTVNSNRTGSSRKWNPSSSVRQLGRTARTHECLEVPWLAWTQSLEQFMPIMV